MYSERRIAISLLMIRVSIFAVMLVWTLDKFINPSHAAAVYEYFYFMAGLGKGVIYTLGGIELLIILAFVCGIKKSFTYASVLLFHAISTFASYRQYLSPFEEINMLFFAAWPMLAACAALYLLRDLDVRWVIKFPS